MLNSKECRHRFNQITKRKENEGYTDWRKWVIEQISDYDEEKMLNLIKRYEVKLRNSEVDDGFSLFQIASQYVPIFLTLLPFVGTIFLTSFDTLIGVYNSTITGDIAGEYAKIVNNTISELGSSLISIGCAYAIFIVVILTITKYLDSIFVRRHQNIIVYYEELLRVLKKVQESNKGEKKTDEVEREIEHETNENTQK